MSLSSRLRTVLILGRVSNLPTIWSNVLVGWFLSGGPWTAELAWILLGMSLLYIAGMTLNDAFDVEWDRTHATERPVPSGRISLRSAWILGIAQILAGILILTLFTSAHLLLTGLLVLSIFAYNWLHKQWKGSVLIMGICRALVYVGAGSAVAVQTDSIEVSPIAWLVAVAMIFYIAGITLAARSEHLKAPVGTSFLPRLLLMLPVLFPLMASRNSPGSAVETALVVVGVVGIWAWLVIVRGSLRTSVPTGIAQAIAGIAFFDAAVVVFADWKAAVACLLCFGITLLAQRHIPAT